MTPEETIQHNRYTNSEDKLSMPKAKAEPVAQEHVGALGPAAQEAAHALQGTSIGSRSRVMDLLFMFSPPTSALWRQEEIKDAFDIFDTESF